MDRVLSELHEGFVSHTAISRAVSRAVSAGRLRKLASRLYTNNLDDAPEDIVKRNLWGVVSGYFPGALVADRTAFEAAPASDGSLCLVSERGRTTELPGVVLRPRRGPGPIASDMPFVSGLRLSSRARAYLENMRSSRARSGRVPRTLRRAEVEERLDRLLRTAGESAVNRLRDDARAIAVELGLEKEAAQFDALTGTLLGTRRSRLDSPVAIAPPAGTSLRSRSDGVVPHAASSAPQSSSQHPARAPAECKGSVNAGVLRGVLLELRCGDPNLRMQE